MQRFKKMEKGMLTDSDMNSFRYRILYLVMLLLITIYCVISFFPVLWILLSGFKDVKEMYAVPTFLFPKHIDLSKLWRVWTEMKFYKYYLSTFVMAGGAVAADVLVSGMAGFALSRLKPKGTKYALIVLVWIMLMPGTMRTVPLYMTFKDFPLIHANMLDTFWPIWLMAATNVFDIILFKNFFDGISISLIEAARIDGSHDLGIFFKIILPLSVPVFMTVSLFTFNGHIGQFFWPYLLISKSELTVLGVQLFKLKSTSYTMDYQMLALLFSILPQVLIFAVFQKQIIGGVNVGGVKE